MKDDRQEDPAERNLARGGQERRSERGHGRVSTLRVVTAEILDFLTVFFTGRYLIGLVAGTSDDAVFKLDKWQGLALVAMIVAYFYLLSRTEGGTLWQRILKARRH
ncbi:hypothetical protein [Salaquimonas pukyongi]|uniref:hypothetical protein n=1 Tax=Salaquimonas pukyongi TaxID=2712698 RepID=UPI0009FB1888|nr:hypothetical protein [Salaquimonas pukyongi]